MSQDVVILNPATPFEVLTRLTSLEFAIFPSIAIAGVFLWTRKDFGISLLGSILLLFDGALLVALYRTAAPWPGLLALAFLLFIAFGYTAVLSFLDLARGRRESDP